MEKSYFLLSQYKKKYDFRGGLICSSFKENIYTSFLYRLPLPKRFYLYIKTIIPTKSLLRIEINQHVLRGQPLIFGNDYMVPMHSPTSGWIEDIVVYQRYNNNTVYQDVKIVIKSDNQDRWIRLKPIRDYEIYTPIHLIKIIFQSGIVGLGGGQFVSSKKLMLSIKKVHTLIINAMESEPYITADSCLINNYMQEIITGCKIISWISKVTRIIIAIEYTNLKSISKINELIKDESLFQLFVLPQKYPGGSSKILIKTLFGIDIPFNQHAIDIGYLIFNIATVYSIKRAVVNGEPLTERIITCAGDKSLFPGNFWVRIGTPIEYILSYQKYKKFSNITVYLGGPFMGDAIIDFNISIEKKDNCILILSKKEISQNIVEYPCIRCGKCAQQCPVNLLPQQLYWYSKNNDHIQTQKYHILDCIECKICEKVCPSQIPLVQYFQNEKKIHYKMNILNNRKKISLSRFNNRTIRLLKEKKIITEKNTRKEQIQAAIQRVKKKICL